MKNKNLLIVIGFAILLIAGFYFIKSEASQNGFISINMYNQDGKLIAESKGLSVVNDVPGVSSIDLTITLTNTGEISLDCTIGSLTPSSFDSAVTKGIKTIPVGGKASWTSTKIDVKTLESTAPVVFSATATCTYKVNIDVKTITPKKGTLSISIISDPIGGFDISVNQGTNGGTTPTNTCGDGTCQNTESITTCQSDCAIGNNVKFRTSDSSYSTSSAISYTSSCGTILTAYGYTGSGSGACSSSNTGYVLLNFVTKEGYLICTRTGYPTRLYVQKGANLLIYDSTDSDATKVTTGKTSIDSAKEVAC